MKKVVFIFTVFNLLLCANALAQSREDVIYLSNGSILRGKILEHISGIQTKVEIVGQNVIVVPDSVIKLILNDQVVSVLETSNKRSAVEMAASVSFFGGTKNTAGCSFITSYRFPFRLSLGAGIGNEWFNHQQIPFIVDVKYSVMKGSWSPYVYAQSGFAVPLSKKSGGNNYYDLNTEYFGGVLAAAGAGMRFDFTNRNALIFSLGYRYQKTKTITGYSNWSYYQVETIEYDEFNRLTFSVGFLFN